VQVLDRTEIQVRDTCRRIDAILIDSSAGCNQQQREDLLIFFYLLDFLSFLSKTRTDQATCRSASMCGIAFRILRYRYEF